GNGGRGLGGAGGGSACPNGVLDPGEECDGSDFGGATCASLGLGSGELACDGTCTLVTSGCGIPEVCTNFVDDDGDGLVDCDDPDCALDAACPNPCTSPEAISVIPSTVSGDTTGQPWGPKPSCTSTSGRAKVYAFQSIAWTGPITVELQSASTDFSLSVRTDCTSAGNEIACSNAGPAGTLERVVLPSVAN